MISQYKNSWGCRHDFCYPGGWISDKIEKNPGVTFHGLQTKIKEANALCYVSVGKKWAGIPKQGDTAVYAGHLSSVAEVPLGSAFLRWP